MDWSEVINRMKDFFDMGIATQAQLNVFWAANVLFSWRWFLKLAMLVLPWVFWAVVRKRDSSARLLLAGFFMIATSVFLDELGAGIGLWFYPATIQPFMAGNTAYNLSALPVTVMLFIQFFPRIKPVFKALVFAASGAFVLEPAMVWLGLYRNVHWNYVFSFPVLFVQYLIAHRLALKRSFEPIA